MAAGPDGAELIAFGAPNTDNKDIDMVPGFWRGQPARSLQQPCDRRRSFSTRPPVCSSGQ